MSNIIDRQKGIIALVALAIVYASTGLFIRYLSTGFQLFQQVYLRILAAFLLGLVFFRRDIDFSKLQKISRNEWLLLIFRAFAYYVVGVTLYSQAVLITKYSNVSFISAIPMSAIYGFILLKEKATFGKIAYITLAFIGVLFISVTDYRYIFSWGYAEVLALLSTASYTLSLVARKWQSNLLNNKEITLLLFFITIVFLVCSSLLFGEGLPLKQWTWGLLLAIAGTGLLNLSIMFLSNFGFKYVEAVHASNILTLDAIFAAMFGFIIFKEIPTFKELIGGAVILVSVVGMNKAIATAKT